MPKKISIFIVIIEERHISPTVHPFSTAEAAIAFARNTAKSFSPDILPKEIIYKDWIYAAYISDNEEAYYRVGVVERKLDGKRAWYE